MTRGRSTAALGALLLLLLAIAVAFTALRQRQPIISDTIGYVAAGRGLAAGQGLAYSNPLNESVGPFFSLYAFGVTRPGDPRYFLGFPPGYPLLLGAAAWLTGSADAPFLVNPLLALAVLAATFGLAAALFRQRWAGFWAAAFLAMAPLFWRYGTEPWSDLAATAFVVAGAWAYLRARAPDISGRRETLFSALAALLLGYGFFVRYANVAVLPAFALYELLQPGPRRRRGRWPFFVLLATALLALPLFNRLYYGGFTLTSYSPQHGWYPWPGFSLAYALGDSPVGGRSLPAIGETLWATFGLALLFAPFGLTRPGRSRAALARPAFLLAAFLGLVAPYAVYAFAARDVNSRFLLPALPFLAAALAGGVLWLGERLPSSRWRVVAGLALAALLALPLPARVGALRERNQGDAEFVTAVRALVDDTPPDAVFLSYRLNDEIVVYGGRSSLNYRRIPRSLADEGRYELEQLEPCLVEAIDALLAAGRPVYYVVDRDPPFWDSLALLEANFTLTRTREDPPVYGLAPPADPGSRADLEPCRSRLP